MNHTASPCPGLDELAARFAREAYECTIRPGVSAEHAARKARLAADCYAATQAARGLPLNLPAGAPAPAPAHPAPARHYDHRHPGPGRHGRRTA